MLRRQRRARDKEAAQAAVLARSSSATSLGSKRGGGRRPDDSAEQVGHGVKPQKIRYKTHKVVLAGAQVGIWRTVLPAGAVLAN